MKNKYFVIILLLVSILFSCKKEILNSTLGARDLSHLDWQEFECEGEQPATGASI